MSLDSITYLIEVNNLLLLRSTTIKYKKKLLKR